MATRYGSGSFVENDESVITKLRSAAEGPGGTPYVDGREMAAFFAAGVKVASYAFTPDTTTDDNGDTIAVGDDVAVDVGFIPIFAILTIDDTTSSKLYIKSPGLGGAYAWHLVDAGGSDLTLTTTLVNNAMTISNTTLTIGNSITITALVHTLFIVGK